MSNFRIILIFVSTLLFSSCYETAKIANQNLAFTYERNAQVLHPMYAVYHGSPNQSQLHFSINTQELLYMKSVGAANYMAKISVSYILYVFTNLKPSGSRSRSRPFRHPPTSVWRSAWQGATESTFALSDADDLRQPDDHLGNDHPRPPALERQPRGLTDRKRQQVRRWRTPRRRFPA